ncbi:DoxX family protein [Oceanibium sediminis]|uniref:DoxX family protein n=1 Tax=Oceanibium sediminis TaxID=2026339 RepID=UPI000DD3CE0F|nr:DoxX family membrane protein [Oceanibium sediminis]
MLGRYLLAALFLAGTVQKALDPAPVMSLLQGMGLPGVLVWPALLFNVAIAVSLISGRYLRPAALLAAAYCAGTSLFHLVPDDPWQMSIFVKNWAIAGGLLVLAAHSRQSA